MAAVFSGSPRAGRVAIIAVCWTMFLVGGYVDHWLLVDDLVRIGKLEGSYAFLPDFAAAIVIGLVGGLLGGYVLVYRLNPTRRHRSFLSDIARSALVFTAVFVVTAAVVVFALAFGAAVAAGDAGGAFQAGARNVAVNLYGASFVSSLVVWGALVAATQFMLLVNDTFGPGVLPKLLTGRYYHPREEERVFMFLDLRSSTSIAEDLGHRRFFELLREVYRDITRPIIESGGQIYQYVGDEVVVSWDPDVGLHRGACVRCFFGIEDALAAREDAYRTSFGVAPAFKAGLHIGPAMVGEIGTVKKDIVYSGDVLNTTARIQGECNRHRINLLVSGELLARLAPDEGFHTHPIGAIPLRGKAEPLALSVVLPA